MGALKIYFIKIIISFLSINLLIASNHYNDLIYSHIPENSDNSHIDANSNHEEVRKLLRYIYFSRVSYLTGSSKKDIQDEFPGAVVRTTKKTKTRYFIHTDHKEKRITLAIRGSNNIRNWLLNLEFWMKENDWFSHKVHRGFLKIAQEIYDSIKDDFEPSYKITLTGHSMGGAVSTLIGAHLQNLGHQVEVITFAQPRVTNNRGAQSMGKLKLTRVVIQGDVVNLLPPFNYAHFGEELILESDRYNSKEIDDIHMFDQEPEIYLPLVKIRFGGKEKLPSKVKDSRPVQPIETKTITFYNSYVHADELAAVHSLNQYFKALRARISDLLGGIEAELNRKLETIEFPPDRSERSSFIEFESR
ncbi:MAG: lipase family protein [bacterium]|nr:lipase family protein [bacterium]